MQEAGFGFSESRHANYSSISLPSYIAFLKLTILFQFSIQWSPELELVINTNNRKVRDCWVCIKVQNPTFTTGEKFLIGFSRTFNNDWYWESF